MKLAQVTFTDHFLAQAKAKGFTAEQIMGAIERPYKITAVTRFPGQERYCGCGVAIVMKGSTAITIYLDGVITPMREDQKSDPNAVNSQRLNRKA